MTTKVQRDNIRSFLKRYTQDNILMYIGITVFLDNLAKLNLGKPILFHTETQDSIELEDDFEAYGEAECFIMIVTEDDRVFNFYPDHMFCNDWEVVNTIFYGEYELDEEGDANPDGYLAKIQELSYVEEEVDLESFDNVLKFKR